jgi:pimeloyl-ACP methyl ester carboxylesterase
VDGPGVVALHGFGDAGECWRPFLDALAVPPDRRWLPDAPGHGGRPVGSDFAHETLVAAAVPVVGVAVSVTGRPAVLVGHSMGASTALGVAAARPDLVRVLVLEDPPWGMPRDPVSDAALEREVRHEPWIRGLQQGGESGTRAWVEHECAHWPEDEVTPWVAAKLAVDLTLFAVPQRWLLRSWGPPARSLRCPVLLVTGDPDAGAALEPAVADTLESRAGWTVVSVTGAGHSVRRDARPLLLPLLRGVLDVESARLS